MWASLVDYMSWFICSKCTSLPLRNTGYNKNLVLKVFSCLLLQLGCCYVLLHFKLKHFFFLNNFDVLAFIKKNQWYLYTVVYSGISELKLQKCYWFHWLHVNRWPEKSVNKYSSQAMLVTKKVLKFVQNSFLLTIREQRIVYWCYKRLKSMKKVCVYVLVSLCWCCGKKVWR